MRRNDERCEGVFRTQAEATRRAALLREGDHSRRFWVIRALDRWAVQSERREQASLIEEPEG